MENLTAAITPSEAKLAKHAVQSVRQRVTNLYEWGITDIAALQQHLTREFSLQSTGSAISSPTLTLTPQDVEQIEQIEQNYLLMVK